MDAGVWIDDGFDYIEDFLERGEFEEDGWHFVLVDTSTKSGGDFLLFLVVCQ